MKPTVLEREIEETGALSTGMFGLSEKAEDQAHILSILRDRLYTNKILAVLREYSTNAWDAHVDAGKTKTPILVRLPTSLDPTYVVRDYGNGLSEEDIYEVYTRYGTSTKRGTNKTVGMLGIGCKSAFAYSDSFTITSHHAGKKKIYTAALDASHMGKMTKQYEGDTTETGIEIRIPVNPKDEAQFISEAKRLFPFFDPQPQINIQLLQVKQSAIETPDGFILRQALEGLPQWTARMGCVPYRLDFRSVPLAVHKLQNEDGSPAELTPLQNFIEHSAGCLYFRLGEVDVSANREELEYTERTKKAIVKKLIALRNGQSEAIGVHLSKLKGLQKRIEAMSVFEKTGIKLPDELKHLTRREVTLYKIEDVLSDPKDSKSLVIQVRGVKTFKAMALQKTQSPDGRRKNIYTFRESRDFQVTRDARIILQDEPDHRKLKYYSGIEDGRATFIQPVPPHTLDEALAELEPLLETLDLQGVLITRTTSLRYNPPAPKDRGDVSRYKAKVFRWLGSESEDSRSWEVSPTPLDPTDLYVLLDRFVCDSVGLREIIKDKEVLRLLAPFDTFPEIYGIKTTQSEPIERKDVPARHYDQWRKLRFQQLVSEDPELEEVIDHFKNYTAFGGGRGGLYADCVKAFEKTLGKEHVMCEMLRGVRDTRILFNRERHRDLRQQYIKFEQSLVHSSTLLNQPPKISLSELVRRYPLLPREHDDFGKIINDVTAPAWARYIKLIDKHGA